jgi:hypothetical protein
MSHKSFQSPEITKCSQFIERSRSEECSHDVWQVIFLRVILASFRNRLDMNPDAVTL